MKNIWIITFVITVCLIGGVLYQFYSHHQTHPVIASGQVAIGGPFALTDKAGKTVTDKDVKGKFLLVYFGFTTCPAICPTDLATLSQVMKQLKGKADQLQPIFITIDPERDTPEQLQKYMQQFDARILALTGTPEQIAEVAKEYKVYYNKVSMQNNAPYMMDHSAFIYLMDREGRYVAHFEHGAPAEKIVKKIKEVMEE